jgi:hypothetical protein
MVRVMPSGGVNGRANPIQNDVSSGSSHMAIVRPAGRSFNSSEAQATSPRQTPRNALIRGTVVGTPTASKGPFPYVG